MIQRISVRLIGHLRTTDGQIIHVRNADIRKTQIFTYILTGTTAQIAAEKLKTISARKESYAARRTDHLRFQLYSAIDHDLPRHLYRMERGIFEWIRGRSKETSSSHSIHVFEEQNRALQNARKEIENGYFHQYCLYDHRMDCFRNSHGTLWVQNRIQGLLEQASFAHSGT